MNKIKNFLNKNYKSLLFCLIFIIICFIYNQNFQSLNFILKRGVILEYSLAKNTVVDSEKIKDKLVKEGLKYSYIKDFKDINSKIYDSDDKLIVNVLDVALPIKPDKNNIDTINNISDYIYEMYPQSKLTGLKALNDNYHKPFSTFVRFLGLFFVSAFIWAILLYLFFSEKDFFKKAKESCKKYLNEKKEMKHLINPDNRPVLPALTHWSGPHKVWYPAHRTIPSPASDRQRFLPHHLPYTVCRLHLSYRHPCRYCLHRELSARSPDNKPRRSPSDGSGRRHNR